MNRTEAQAFIDELAKKWKVPTIKVIVEPLMPKRLEPCFFAPTDYEIAIKNEVTDEDMRHEWRHYIVQLLRIMPDVEEYIANGNI